MKTANRNTISQRLPKHSWKLRTMTREANEAIRTSRSLREASAKLGVHVSTLSRGIKGGKLTSTGPRRPPAVTGPAPPVDPGSFEAWALATFDFSRGERELVALAQLARDVAGDPAHPMTVRLAASREYRALLAALNLPVEKGDEHHGDVQTFPRRA
jgi:hypothetical protein